MQVEKNDDYSIKSCSLRDAQMIMVDILSEVHRICEKHGIKYYLSDGTLLGAVRHGGFIPWDDDLDISMMREDYDKFLKIAAQELSKDFFLQTFYTDPYYDVYHIPLKIRHNGSIFIEKKEKNKKYHQGIYIDIFPIDKVPDSKFKHKFQKFISKSLLTMKMDISTEDFPSLKFWGRSFLQLLGKIMSFKFINKMLHATEKWNKESKSHTYTYGHELMWSTEYKEEDLLPLKNISFEGKEFLGPNNPNAILTKLYGDYMKLPPEQERVWHAEFIGIKDYNKK